MRTLDKRAVRIEIAVPSSDRKLIRWMPWARRHVGEDIMARLIDTGGGPSVALTWWIYLGVLKPKAFRATCVRDASGDYVPFANL
jgi:hypothetical protein